MFETLIYPKSSDELTWTLFYITSPLLIVGCVLLITRTVTTWNYHRALRSFQKPSHGGQQIISPITIPYSVPWLGHTLSFMDQSPGKFWQNLVKRHPRYTGICTLIVGGRKTHVVYSPTTVQAVFRAKGPNRDATERDLFREVFQMSPEQVHNAEITKNFEVQTNSNYLNNFERVNELTLHFTKALDDIYKSERDAIQEYGAVNLFAWVRKHMFDASCKALFGEKLYEFYPTYSDDFVHFDVDVMRFLYRTPKFLMRDAIARRQRIFDRLEEWSREMTRLSGGAPVDPDNGPAWEPLFGSRFNRARQRDYKLRNLAPTSGAALDAGLTFGLASNAIPATAWMLLNILSPQAPKNLLPEVLAEIEEAKKSDGSLDIATLVSQPVLQSVFTETLRMYTDVLVARSLPENLMLPVDEDGKYLVSLRKGDFLVVPGWLGHRDDNHWSSGGSPQNVFDPERFLERDPKTGRATFNFGRMTGKFLPFGGGKTICPGRTFAKQESIGALAMILMRFRFDVEGFVDASDKPTDKFPGLLPTLPGSGVLSPGGDMLVRIYPRE